MSVEISQQEISFRNSSINYIQYIRQYIKIGFGQGFQCARSSYLQRPKSVLRVGRLKKSK